MTNRAAKIIELQERFQQIRSECSKIQASKSGRELEKDEEYRKLLGLATKVQSEILLLQKTSND